MYVLTNLHYFIFFIGALIFFHELGHFLVAKACNVKVLKFSLGFGPKLLAYTWGETTYQLALLPLGGYVKMIGEVPGDDQELGPDEAHRALSARPLWQRIAVVTAGPIFNLVLAFFIYFGMFVGSGTFGDTKLGIVSYDGPAWQAGIRPGDRITRINGEDIDDWDDLRNLIGDNQGADISMSYARDGKVTDIVVTPHIITETNVFKETTKRGRVGISLQYILPLVGIVDDASPAALAGVKTGDKILAVGGKKIEAWHELRQTLAKMSAEEKITLKILRGEEEISIEFMASADFPEGVATAYEGLFSAANLGGAYTGLVSKESLVTEVEAETPAARMGLQPGDQLLSLSVSREGDFISQPIGVWGIDLAAFHGADARSDFKLSFLRGSEIHATSFSLDERTEKDEFKNMQTRHIFGAKNDMATISTYLIHRPVGVFEATAVAFSQVIDDATMIYKGLSKVVSGDVPMDSMGGPIMLFVIAEKSAKRGLEYFLRMMAMISVNLGLLNLLPIPVLDGGHLLFFLVEGVRRKPAPMRVREIANMIGLALMLLLMVLVFHNDIVRYVLG